MEARSKMPKYRGNIIGVYVVTNGTLAATGSSNATRIAPANAARRALLLRNIGTAPAYYSYDPTRTTANVGNSQLLAGEAIAPGTAPVAPQNDVYAVGDAGAQLVVEEIVEDSTL